MKNAIVTGAAGGIGLATVKRLHADGYAVLAVDILPEAAARERLSGLDRVTYRPGDLGSAEGRAAIVSAAKTLPRIDVLVNVAGVAPTVRADILEMTEESYDRVMGINTKGTLFLTQAIARQMLTQQPDADGVRGVIVNISSCSAEVSSVNRGEYCVSKAGVAMLTQLYADRLAGEGILVHEVRPGVIDTDMTGTVHEKYDRLIAEGAVPIPRWGTPEDVARVVGALCAPGAFAYTTGDVIDVDGGFHIRRL